MRVRSRYILVTSSSWATEAAAVATTAPSCSYHPNHYHHRKKHRSLQHDYFHTQIIHWQKRNDGHDVNIHSGSNEEDGKCVVHVGRHISFSPFLDTSPSLSHDSTGNNSATASVQVRALSVNDTTRASTAIRHLRNSHRLIYTGGDYHNARQLLRAVKHKITQLASSSSSLHAPTRRMRKRIKGNHSTQINEHDKNYDNDSSTSIANRQWIEAKKLQQIQSEIARGLLIQVSPDVLMNNGNDETAKNGIMGLKRTPFNTKDVLRYAFQNEDIESMTKKLMMIPTTTATTATTTTAIATATTTNNDNDGGKEDNGSLPASPSSPLILLSLSEFIGMIGGYEWYRKGVYIRAIQEYIYPHYGVFPPTRQDYIPLLDNIAAVVGRRRRNHLGGCADDIVEDGKIMHRSSTTMLEVGIGSGILSIILLKQGKVDHVTGTDINPYAIASARDNMQRLGLEHRVLLLHADVFPPDVGATGYDIVLFNPPWLPGDASTHLDQAVYDPNQRVLRRFLCHVQHHVKEDGYVYMLLSNLGMSLGLFYEQELFAMFDEGNLELVEVFHYPPTESAEISRNTVSSKVRIRKSLANNSMAFDGIASARAREVISLYKLCVKRS